MGLLCRLVFGVVLANYDSTHYDLQTGQWQRDPVAGGWIILDASATCAAVRDGFTDLSCFLQRLKTSSRPADDLPMVVKR